MANFALSLAWPPLNDVFNSSMNDTAALSWAPQPTNPPLFDVFNSTMNDTAGLSYFCFRIPALVRTESALIAFAEGRRNSCGDAGDVRLVSRTSRDDGATWSPIVQVQSETGHTIGNPAPIFDASTGQLHLLFSRDNLQLFSTFSSDEGASWSPRRNLTAALVPAALDPAHAFVATSLNTASLAAAVSAPLRRRHGHRRELQLPVRRGGVVRRRDRLRGGFLQQPYPQDRHLRRRHHHARRL